MFAHFIEDEARVLLRSAGIADDAPFRMQDLVRAHLGPDGIRFVPVRAIPSEGALARVHGDWKIYLRKGLSHEETRFVLGHELAHWALGLDSSSQENEDTCDSLAAALVAPRNAFARALRETGRLSYTRLARWFVTTESCAALRFGEVTDTPLALVAPGRTRIRGAEFEWPGGWSGPGIKRAKLKDDARRIAVRGI